MTTWHEMCFWSRTELVAALWPGRTWLASTGGRAQRTTFSREVSMKKMFLSLWNDEAGFIVSAELILVATLLVIGMIVGLQTVRDTVITELADTATAIGQINQSYSYGGVTGHNSSIAG